MIKVKNLTKYFGKDKVLDNISFEIQKGEICGFIGENGAGKSTTMKILSTEILDYSGSIEIDGKILSENLKDLKSIIGFMPDQYGLYDDMTLREYLIFNTLLYKVKINENDIEKVLEKVLLNDKIDHKISNLSRGMTQRICLARALILKPKILILDEPASGLDPKLRIKLKNILLQLKNEGITIFVSSHILSELGEYCDKIIFINNGKIIKNGNLEKLKKETNIIKILLKTNNDKKAKEILEKNIKLKSIIISNKLEIIINKNDDEKNNINSNKILKLLIENNIHILYFQENQADLEDIYLEIIK